MLKMLWRAKKKRTILRQAGTRNRIDSDDKGKIGELEQRPKYVFSVKAPKILLQEGYGD